MEHNQDILVCAIDEILRPTDFVRRKRTWRLTKPDTVLVVDLRKSRWSESFIVELGVSVRQLSDDEKPVFWKCHIRESLTSMAIRKAQVTSKATTVDNPIIQKLRENPLRSIHLTAEDVQASQKCPHPSDLSQALDFEDQTVDEAFRTTAVAAALTELALPFFERFGSLAAIKQSLIDPLNRSIAASGSVFELLGVPING